uniref:MHC class I antigen n=3 Tax=Rhinella marina TaxID=8386 RepID=W8CL37_RHIMB|nr:MHC class I antigen [Rhinella marina]
MYTLIVLLLYTSPVYSDSHSLRYYVTGVSAPGSGLPEYSEVGYVDDQEIANYNTESRNYRPKVKWMGKMETDYWGRETQIARQAEAVNRHNMKTLMSRFNQTEGIHILQRMYGCELRDDGSIKGYEQLGYDGEEFMSLDTQTWTFIPTMPQAQISTERLNNAGEGGSQKNYLEDKCVYWLNKYVEHGREDLERRVQPQVKVSGQKKDDAMMLHCQVYGFHPRPVHVKWMKNEDDVPSYESTHTLPNPDGTYQIRVSAEVIPEEGDSYSCYVDHSSLGEPLNVVWEPKPETLSDLVMIIAVVVAVVIVFIIGIAGFFLYKRKKVSYKATSTSDSTSDVFHKDAKA